jgi:hypothetical protein
MDRVDMTGIMQTVEEGDMVDVENTMDAEKPNERSDSHSNGQQCKYIDCMTGNYTKNHCSEWNNAEVGGNSKQ